MNLFEATNKWNGQVTELRAAGMPLKSGILTVEELVEEVERLCPLKSAT